VTPYASPQAYRESSVMTASPEQLVVMLYDGANRFLRQAEAALEEGAVAHTNDRLQRAEAILDELLTTLNHDAGEISERLQAIYVFCKRLLVEARLERDPHKVRVVAALLADLRGAWAEIAAGA
jgi:flagellar secretion chaperone FliS